MKLFRWLERWVGRVEDVLVEFAIALLVVCGIGICLDALLRYFFSRPLLGTVELTEYALVYITFLGAAWAVPRGAHIDIDVFVVHMSERMRKVCALLSNLVAFGVAVMLTIFGTSTTWTAYLRHLFKPTLLEIPSWIVLIIIPIGSFVLAIRYAVEIALSAEALATGRPLPQRERGPTID